jgi:hypothetical protein
MDARVEGGDSTATGSQEDSDVPHSFSAATVTVPPAGPASAVMEVSFEVPSHPSGKAHA